MQSYVGFCFNFNDVVVTQLWELCWHNWGLKKRVSYMVRKESKKMMATIFIKLFSQEKGVKNYFFQWLKSFYLLNLLFFNDLFFLLQSKIKSLLVRHQSYKKKSWLKNNMKTATRSDHQKVKKYFLFRLLWIKGSSKKSKKQLTYIKL